MNDKFSVPTPEVQHIVTIFRRIRKGDVRLPAFQRGLVWKEEQIRYLLDSIYKGYPVGSLLLWRSSSGLMKTMSSSNLPFPMLNAEEAASEASFVLDGLQRLTALYGAFFYSRGQHDRRFEVSFDLRRETFVSGYFDDPAVVPMNILLVPERLLERQANLLQLPDGSSLVKGTLRLGSAFQDYLLPMVTLTNANAEMVVPIFQRINSTGTRLGAVDFMRAVVWSDKFDLNAQLIKLAEHASKQGYEVPHETLLKVFAISAAKSPTTASMLGMRTESFRSLASHVSKAKVTLEKALHFVSRQLGVGTYDMIPYEALFLVICAYVSSSDNRASSAKEHEVLARWYWTSCLNEDMQGRSEAQVARLVEAVRERDFASHSTFLQELKIDAKSVNGRLFRWGTALAACLSSLLVRRGCCSVFDGRRFEVQEVASRAASSNYTSIVEGGWRKSRTRPGRSRRFIPGVIVMSALEQGLFRQRGLDELVARLESLEPAERTKRLESQLIDARSWDCMKKRDRAGFLKARSEYIVSSAAELMNPPA